MKLNGRSAVVLAAPALAVYLIFLVYPAIRGVWTSFTDARGVVGGRYVGLANYSRLLDDPAVWAALRNSLVFMVIVVVVQNGLGLLLASALSRLPAVRGLVRTGLLMPSMMAVVVVGYLWSQVYSPIGGPLNTVLGAVGLQDLERVWLGDPATALPAIAVANVWMYLGYSTTIFLANYLAIPAEVLDAAALDGTSAWSRLRHVDWPLLAPSLTVNVTLALIGSLRVFDLPLVMTRGGPADTTQTLSLLIYRSSFQDFQFGRGSAVAVVLLAATLVTSILLTSLLRRREAVL